jgi:putative nucleotidyltransferase with HDIG domain
MPLQTKTFNSKVALGIFGTFVLCALGPIFCLAVLAHIEIAQNLEHQGRISLGQAAKTEARYIYDRLRLAELDLDSICALAEHQSPEDLNQMDERLLARLSGKFKSITFFDPAHRSRPLLNGTSAPPLTVSPEDIAHLNAGKTLLNEMRNEAGVQDPSIFMTLAAGSPTAGRGFIVGDILFDYLWPADETESLPDQAGFCVLDSSNNLIHSSEPGMFKLSPLFKAKTRDAVSGNFEFGLEGSQYLACYTQLFIKANYKLPGWTVILFKPRSEILRPVENFKQKFPLVVIGTVLFILWLSIVRIRKRMVPVADLIEGANKIAAGDFNQHIAVSSGDEFERLASAFNQMSATLGHNFKTLSTRAEIDRTVLSTYDSEKIAVEAIRGIRDCIDSVAQGLCLVDPTGPFRGRVFTNETLRDQAIESRMVKIESADIRQAIDYSDHLILHAGDPMPDYLGVPDRLASRSLVLLPLWFNRELIGVLWVAVAKAVWSRTEDLAAMRQLADQLAIALSNAKMVADLKEMSWGALMALARTVDAKSAWTAGHSQRVTDLALEIGGELGLDAYLLENLQRASLLHDIGKVGISSAILNKPGRLTEAEFRVIQSHSELGVRIIEPIAAFREIIPIIAQHHERYDGNGYPFGYAGNGIHRGARILSVADVFDALTSERPYRRGMAIGDALTLMHREAGRQFDPAALEALLGVMRRKGQKTNPEAGTHEVDNHE